MATNASVLILFSDGSLSYLRDAVTLDSLSEVKTDESSKLNIAGGLAVGQANQNKTAVAAMVKIQTDSATTGCFSHAAFYGVQGEVLCPIQGGGTLAAGMPQLIKPVRMTTGITVKVLAQAKADEVQIASFACYSASGKCDILSVTAVDGVATELVNKDGNTLGECMVGERIIGAYATYPATNGLADTGVSDGINALYVEDSAGQLKGLIPTTMGGGATSESPVAYIPQGYTVRQNDSLFVCANV